MPGLWVAEGVSMCVCVSCVYVCHSLVLRKPYTVQLVHRLFLQVNELVWVLGVATLCVRHTHTHTHKHMSLLTVLRQDAGSEALACLPPNHAPTHTYTHTYTHVHTHTHTYLDAHRELSDAQPVHFCLLKEGGLETLGVSL